jgi:hypothetical protein
MSALPLKADIHCGSRNVRFGPQADIGCRFRKTGEQLAELATAR